MAESVELATIWLVDLVGSTKLATAVGPAQADELRDEYFALLREAIERSGGREFKNTGDGLFVAFWSASAAVRCAVLAQQLFERRYRGAGQQLRVRIGLGTGESTVKDGDYFGMPSIEAARLCDKAPADGILISPATRMLAGRVDGVTFESMGELELKGIPEPMEAFLVLWEPLDPEGSAGEVGRWPLPEALRVVPRTAYVGREVARGLLDVARSQARSGARRVVLLSGEPGIGKTRLASYSALGANADGFAVCWGACSEDLAAPYEPWIGVCSQLVEHMDGDLLAGYAQLHGSEMARLAGNLARRAPGAPARQTTDPETERFLLFKAVAELLRTVAASVPVCVVLDDFQWADGQSVALLKHLARNLEHGRLHLLVTYRDSDLTKDHPLTAALADLRRLDGVERIPLQGLQTEDVLAMTTAAAGHELDADGIALAAEIAAETGGNPFFVGEILRNLSESGLVVYDEQQDRWVIDRSSGVALPESVREVVERRVDVLGTDARQTLTAAAVIGRSFDLDLLAQLVGLDEVKLLDQLEAAVQASLLVESPDRVGRFTFAHALINHTLYNGLGGTRRARMHLQVAEALEALYGGDAEERLAELALHWRLATVSVDKRKAAHYSLRAGRRALDSLAPAEAVKLFSDAVELIGDVDGTERCEALIGLGEAQLQTGDGAYRETLLDAARIASTMADAELAARAALANNRGNGVSSAFGEIDTERVAAIERALELDDPPNRARRARLLAIKALELEWDPDVGVRRSLAEEAISLARAASDRRTLAEVLRNIVEAVRAPDTLAWRLGLGEELVDCAAEVGDPALRISAHTSLFNTCVEQGDLDRAKLALERATLLAHELDQPTLNWFSMFNRAGWELIHGDLVASEPLFEGALQIAQEAGQPDAVFVYAAALQQARIFQGRAQEVVAMMEQSVSAYPAIAAWRAGLAAMIAYLDRGAEAAKILKQAASDRFEHIARNSATLTALALYADTAALTGSSGPASILYELLEPWADQVVWNGVIGYGHARMWLGLLAACIGDHEHTDEHLAFACDFQETHGLLLWAARAHLGWAQALAGRGDAARAREHAARALELSREHGYGAFEPRAAAILEATSHLS